ncbi:MAG: OpgC domain-containing protein [Geminicoccaceae bacterium]
MSVIPARDARLDLFRGLAMAIILIAHIPGNPWIAAIPARFGPSDATEMFVFCSGFASALAFGATFRQHGFGLGALRILHRCWQVYWAHLGLFVAVASLCVAGTLWLGTADYVHGLWLQHFFAEPAQGLLGLVTLRYVPNYFDILPMYLVVLAMVPVAMLLARLHPALVALASLALYLAQAGGGLDLRAEWWSDRPWFFDPFAWQLLFFTGFAFAMGWLPPPPRSRRLLGLALALVLLLIPLSWLPLATSLGWLEQASAALAPWRDKTHLGPLRLVHFLALAYLALWAVERWPALRQGAVAACLTGIGQQTLPVFLWSMTFAQALGMALDQTGRGPFAVTALNGLGLLSLVAVAALARLMKAQPWRQRVRHPHPFPQPVHPQPPHLQPPHLQPAAVPAEAASLPLVLQPARGR